MIVCKVCGHSNPDTEQFCENCKSFLEFTGERLDASAATAAATGPGVGATQGAAQPTQDRTAATGVPAVGQGTTAPAVGPDTTAPVDAANPRCPRCGTPNESTRVFCKFCGERLTANAPVLETTTTHGREINPRMALGGGLVVLAIGAVAVFALVLSNAGPAASPTPGLFTSAPTQAAGETAGSTESAEPTSEPTESAEPTSEPTASETTEPTAEPTTEPTAAATLEPVTPATTIVFYGVRGGPADIFAVSATRRVITNLTQDAPPDSDPKWSPDGKFIVFDSRRGNGERNIWTRDLENNYSQLTADTGVNNAFPTWSPNGAQIAWVRNGEIWIMNADGGDQRAVTTGSVDGRPSWSTANQIAFFRTTPGNHEIFTVPAEGGNASVLLGVGQGGGRQPSWSPDGSRLAYAKLEKSVLRIWVVNTDGSGGESLTPGSPCPCQFPTWSPDGEQIAFQGGTTKKEQIYVVPATGGSPKRVTDGKFQNLVPGWGT